MSSGGITNGNHHSGNNQNTWKEYLETVEADGINEDAADDADSGTMMDNDAIREANTGVLGGVDNSTTTTQVDLSCQGYLTFRHGLWNHLGAPKFT